jgi:hypothetical protein
LKNDKVSWDSCYSITGKKIQDVSILYYGHCIGSHHTHKPLNLQVYTSCIFAN